MGSCLIELKEYIDKTRAAYIENDYEYASPGALAIEMKEDVIVRIYTVFS